MSHDRSRRYAFTLKELCAVVAVLLVLFVGVYLYTVPELSINRECSTRLVCVSNLKGVGTSMKIYANDNNGVWPSLAFDESLIGMIDYTVSVGGGEGSVRSPSRDQPSVGGPGGARQLSSTRSFWMLVRSGDIVTQQFICPNSGDTPDTTQHIENYYDFQSYNNVSYGFQVPFGPSRTRGSEGMDNRMVLAADKGPYFLNHSDPTWKTGDGRPITIDDPPKDWRPFNSPNHGGVGHGEGQNCLFADGHAKFHRTPIVGVDHDNIYTVAKDNESLTGRIYGESPWKRSAHPFLPFDPLNKMASTDSVIFP